MSPLQHRQPGLVGAAFNHSKAMASIIPDGYHVDFAAIAIAKKIMGNRLLVITDAVSETNEGPYQHQLAGDKYECNGVLSGSALSMHKAFKNLVKHVGIEIEEALRMCSLYPAQVLGCDGEYGKIVPQAAGQFLVLDKQLEIAEVITS
jgi:N-acetylglucosamine-6-phosphate deacetylase